MFILDIAGIAADQRHSAIVRQTAQQILDNESGYFKPGDWLKSLALADVLQMCVCIEKVDETASSDHPTIIQIKTLTALLAQGEGVDVDLDDLAPKVLLLIRLLLGELSARHGVVTMAYDRITFNDDTGTGVRQPPFPDLEQD